MTMFRPLVSSIVLEISKIEVCLFSVFVRDENK